MCFLDQPQNAPLPEIPMVFITFCSKARRAESHRKPANFGNLQALLSTFSKSTVITCHSLEGKVNPHKLNLIVFPPGSVTNPVTVKSRFVKGCLNQQRPSFTEYLKKIPNMNKFSSSVNNFLREGIFITNIFNQQLHSNNKQSVNPLTPKSNWHLISPYNIIPE